VQAVDRQHRHREDDHERTLFQQQLTRGLNHRDEQRRREGEVLQEFARALHDVGGGGAEFQGEYAGRFEVDALAEVGRQRDDFLAALVDEPVQGQPRFQVAVEREDGAGHCGEGQRTKDEGRTPLLFLCTSSFVLWPSFAYLGHTQTVFFHLSRHLCLEEWRKLNAPVVSRAIDSAEKGVAHEGSELWRAGRWAA